MKFVAILAVFSLLIFINSATEANYALLLFWEFLPVFYRIRTNFAISDNPNKTIHDLCPGHENDTNLQNAMNTLSKCIKDAINHNRTFCYTLKHEVITECFKPAVAALDKCVDADMEKMPAFFVKEISSVFDFMCNLKGEDILELMHPCMFNLKPVDDHVEKEEYKKCSDKVRQFGKNKDKPLVEEICSFLEDFRPCLEGHLKRYCPTPETKRVILGLYQTIYNPCNEINNLL